MNREIKFEYGFESVNGIIKKHYHLHEIPNIATLCDVWNELPIVYVRQYIERKDKNEVEIYNGDIVKFYKGYVDDSWTDMEQGKPFVIEWINTDGYIGFMARRDNMYLVPNSRKQDKYPWLWEVIGNIYENKELINK